MTLIEDFVTSVINKIDNLISSHNSDKDAHSTEMAKKANVADLKTVATSGSYNDLTNKPTIPTGSSDVNDIQMDGTKSTGSSTHFAKADHTHPTDTTRASVNHTHNKSQITDFPTTMTPTAHQSSSSEYGAATTTKWGHTKLSSATNSTDETTSATPKAVKEAYDLANGKADANHTHDDRYYTESEINTKLSNKSKVTYTPTKTSGIEIGTLNIDGTDTTIYQQDNNTTYSNATTSAAGLMSSTDKTKLDGIATSANNYTHPSYTARTGKPTANQTPSFGETATVSQITSDASGHVTGATDRTIKIPNATATTSAAGLMSSTDKTKLDGVATGANKTTVDSSMSSSSTNPVQNKIVNSAISAKTVTVEKLSTPESGFTATYVVKQNGSQVGASINIPKDFLVKSASLKTCTTANSPLNGLAVNDPYLDFVVNTVGNDGTDSHIYINVKDLVDTYTAGTGITLSNNAFSVNYEGTKANIKMNGTQATGSLNTAARGDHVHPTDTSRAPTAHAVNATTYGLSTSGVYGHAKVIENLTTDAGNGLALGAGQGKALKAQIDSIISGETATDHNHDGSYIKTGTGTVTSTNIADGTIVNGDIANTTITGGKLANGTVTATQLASNAVETAKIKDTNVTTAKIADSAVTTAKIVDNNVTINKIGFTDDIGGTNLLFNTQSFGTGTNGSLTGEFYKDTAIRRYNNTSGTTYVDCSWSNMPPVGEFKIGDKYTLSFWAKGTGSIICYSYGNSGYLTAKPIKSNGSNSSDYGDGNCTFTLSNDWKRFYVTWELNPSGANSSLSVSKTLIIRTSKGANSYIAGVMFERGEIAHDWSINPLENHANRIVAGDGNTKNLNDYVVAGFYYNDKNAECGYISNLPVSGKAFFLLVESWGASNYTKQTVTHYDTNKTYTRIRNAGTWGSWKEISADNNTTYANGTGITIGSGNAINHSNSVTALTTSALKKIKYDAQGHITGTDAVAAGDLPSHTHSYISTTAGSVGASNLASNAVEEAKIKDGAVTSAKIKDANVTNAKLADQTNTITEYITGTQTASTSAWTGKATKISSLASGQVIYYKLPYASTSTAVTLNLTLADGTTTTGAKNVFFWNGQRVTTHYGVNSVVGLVYNGSEWWVINPSTNANNNNYYLANGVTVTNGESSVNFAANNIIGAKKDGKYYKIVNGLVLDVSYPIVEATGAINAGATNNNTRTVNPFVTITSMNITYGTITSNYPLYLEGTAYSKGQFTVSNNSSGCVVCDNSTHSTLTNGRYYIRLGTTYDATHFRFISDMTVYKWDSTNTQMIPIGTSYTDLADKPSTFTPSSHTHTKSQITDFPTSMTPTAHQADTNAYGAATTAKWGHTKLNSATNSTDETTAATPKAVKAAYDLANGKPSLGTTSTTAAKGDHNHDGVYLKSYTPPTASTSQAGIVQLNDAVNSSSTTQAATANAVNKTYTEFSNSSKTTKNGHTHTKSQITDFPTSMTPSSHTHGSITNDGKIGSTASLPIITGTGGVLQAGSFGTTAGTFCQGNDSRLSNARTPIFNHIGATSSATKDLNNYTTGGFYYADNDNTESPYISNQPRTSGQKAFWILVETWGASNNSYVKQTLTYYDTAQTYVRTKRNTSGWTSWIEVTKDTTYTGSDGITLSGTTFKHTNTGLTAQTTSALKKIKYDAQGHITGTDNVSASDLPSHTHSYISTNAGSVGTTNLADKSVTPVKLSGFELIESTHTSSTSTWLGTSSRISSLVAGTVIYYKLKQNPATNNVTLNLTLSDGSTTTGAKNVYYDGSQLLKTQYKRNQLIPLLFDGTNWIVINPYTNTNTTYSKGDGLLLSGTTFSADFGTGNKQVARGDHTHGWVGVQSGTGFDLFYNEQIKTCLLHFEKGFTSINAGTSYTSLNITIDAAYRPLYNAIGCLNYGGAVVVSASTGVVSFRPMVTQTNGPIVEGQVMWAIDAVPSY